jgi:hypothetical protein
MVLIRLLALAAPGRSGGLLVHLRSVPLLLTTSVTGGPKRRLCWVTREARLTARSARRRRHCGSSSLASVSSC